MGKILAFGGVVLLSFFGTVAVAILLLSDSSFTEVYQAVVDPESYAQEQSGQAMEEEATGPALNTLAQQLNERERALEQRRMALDEREKQLNQRESDLEKLRTELEALQASINQSYDTAAENRAAQVKTIAITIEGMDEDKAAETLETMPTDEAAEILLNVEDKKRGEILDAMTTETAARVLKEMRDAR